MNQPPPPRTSLRAFLRECLCDRGPAVTVVSVTSMTIGFKLTQVGLSIHEGLLTATGVLALALPLVLAWIEHDPDAPASPRPRSAPVRGEIARMTDAEFDRLADEVQEQLPVARRRRPARQVAPRLRAGRVSSTTRGAIRVSARPAHEPDGRAPA